MRVLILKAKGLFVPTALAEIVGCYLPFLWLKKSASPWLLLPGARGKPRTVRVATQRCTQRVRSGVRGIRRAEARRPDPS
jgi:drug/metabolite transporter superfamily protein YnfA